MQTENHLITDYVIQHPYPTYDAILDLIENNLNLWSEYGKANHNYCKNIYDNPNNKAMIIEMGKNIYNMGGMQALVKNYTILKFLSPYWKSTDYTIKNQGLRIGEYFKEICPGFTP